MNVVCAREKHETQCIYTCVLLLARQQHLLFLVLFVTDVEKWCRMVTLRTEKNGLILTERQLPEPSRKMILVKRRHRLL